MPTSGMKRANRASEGMVRMMPESASTTARATGRRWITTPSSTEVTVASATTISTIWACAMVSSRMYSRLSLTYSNHLLSRSTGPPQGQPVETP